MRKVDPAAVRADFEAASTELIDHFDRIDKAIKAHPKREGDLSLLATQSFLALFVAFERFCSDLLLAYMNRDFTQYQTDLSTRISASIRDKYGSGVAPLVALTTKKHVSVDELEQIVDPTGWNLTFKSVEGLKEYSRRVLAPVYSQRIDSLNAAEARLIDAARSIRDFIAHQSVGAKNRMNAALRTVEAGGHNRHLGCVGYNVDKVGVYLKAMHVGRRRLHRYADALLAISKRM